VLVIGAGATGLEIATQLADGGARSVYLSVRSCQNLFPREWQGIPLTPPPVVQRLPTEALNAAGAMIHRALGRNWPNPLPRPRAGLGTPLRRDGREPVVTVGLVEALRAGKIELVPAVSDLGEHEVILTDGRTLQPDSVIAATGYTHGLKGLVGHLDVLRPNGLPLGPGGGPIARAPGLAFVGFEPTVTGRLLQLPRQAHTAARVVTT
jgi:putative flavoprotein involved in K+ transport